MTDAKEDGQGAWNKCPVWDGSPLTWRAFRREMTWWVSALDLESTKKYNLAARWLLRQSGTVRQRGEEFLPEELEYQREESAVDPDSGETIVLTPEDPLAGLNKLLAALESLNGQSVLDRRGELRTQFYLHLARRPGERVADYASRFRTAVSDLKSEGVKLPDPEVGWFFREKLGLDALRRQLLDTALQGAEAYGTVEAECLRLFRDLHTQDPLYRKMERGANRLTIKKMFAGTASAASSAGGYPAGRRPPGGPSSSSAGSGGLPGPRRYPPRQAQVAEIEPDEFQDEGEAELVADPNGESEERSLEEVLQAEVETLAEEIAAAEEEGVDPAHLEALESGIEASAEALVSMREARTRLAEVRKDRGYKGPAAQAGGGGKGRGRGGASAAISAKKASGKHLCFDCGGSGHWAGDPECPRPGAGAGRAKTRGPKQVRVAEVVPDNELNEVEFKEAPANEVMMLSAGDFGGALRRSLEIGARPVNEALSMTGLAPDKALVGALDSACNRTCAGSAWLEDYVEHLAEAPEYIRDLVKQEPEKESFKFGNGGILPSLTRWRIPAMIANELVCLWVSAVPVDSLGLLLGRDVLDGLQGVLDFGRRTLWCRLFGAYHAPLERLNAGHLALRLIPRSWPADCGKVRFRKVGPDGVLECCLDCREWTKQLLSARHVPTADELDHEDHSHNLTEASLALGKLAFHFGRDPSSMPVALAQSMTFEHCEARDHAALVGGRWRRMFLRAVARYDWSREGVRLWLVKQPGLRWLPFPYPSVSSVEQWRLQAAAMVEQRTMPGRWLSKAVFNQQNLASMAWLRSRVGLRFAFLEDPIVAGMMAARSQPGRQARLRTAALREAAEHNASKEDREQVARTLLGPRGGLPTLKADLIKLAALMHVEVAEKDTVEKLKGKLRGIVGALCQRVPYVPPEQVQQARMSPTTARTSTRPSDASQSLPASPVATQGPMATSSGSATPHQPSDLVQVMDQRLLDMDNRYQAMFSQLLTHVMSMQGGPSATTAAGDGMDTEMADDWDQVEAPAEESTVDPRIHSLGVLEAAAKSFRGCVVLDEIMAKLLVNALEQQFDFETVSADRTGPETRECYEVLGSSGAVEFYNEVMTEEVVEPELSEDSDEDLGEPFKGEITPAIRNAVRRVHEATGHRSPRRLARALLLSGAPPAAVQAARELRCDVCAEHKRPKARRVGTLPHPRAVGEQAHIDLLLVEDAAGVVFPVCHVTDAVSKFQAAGVIADRSSKSVIEFFTRHWVPLLGAPVRLVADQGREFVSESFQEYCSSHSILLWHAAVQSPWQNSVAERSGGILKAILASVVSDQVIIGKDGMSDAVAEACAAYNQDPNAEGVSPLQCVTGRQPRLQGSVLSNFGSRLAEHGLIDGQPSYAAQMALRESARIAMIRLHFSQSIRRAELARSREPSLTTSLQPGDTVYFWRQQRASRRGDPRVSSSSRRRRLELRRWHGPAVLLALEGHPEGGPPLNAFLSFKGQVTKCCVEHIRPASTLENLAANVWEDAISELLSQVKSEPSLVGAPDMEADLPVIAEEEAEVDGSAPDEIAEAPSRDVSTGNFEEPTLSTAAPGTPVGQLFEHRPSEPLFQRPVLQQALSRARGLPLGQDLRARALLRGQPADFAAELRATMEQQALERGLKRQSESEPGADSTRRRPSATASEPPLSMRRLSNDSRELPAEIPPLPRLSSEPAGGLPLGSAVSDSRELPSEIRPLPQPSSEPAGHGSALIVEGPGGERKVGFEGVVLKHEDLVNIVLNTEVVHPLLRLQAQVELDRKDPLAFKESEPDHGSWDGRWSMPGRSQHELLQALGAPLPTGVADDLHECCAALARKEYKWSQMDEKQRALWGKAAEKGWAAYVDNAAIEILSLKESQAVRTRLAKAGELDRIMQPRFVLTDKADGVRTPENWVPPEPSARLIVPGFQDRANLQGELRRDSPTGSRLSQHLLLSLVAWHGRLWSLLSCDVKSAFLKGDPFVARELYITGTNSKSSPDIPLPPGCLARVLKGIFGLADAPRQWWLRLARALEDRGWERSPLDQATWFLWDGPGHSKLLGVIVSHVDDLLFGGSPPAEQSLMDVGKELGFRDVQRDDFVWCGKRFTRRPDGTIVLSMQEYHENLQEIHVPKHRRGHLTSELDKQEHKKLRALLGSLQWLVAQLRFDLAFHVSALQGEKPCIGTLLRANELCREFKSDPNFELTFRPVDPFSGGLMVVTDSSLGNVTASGSSEAMPLEKVYSQSCYYVVLADRDLMEGRTGRFNILDMRSHRIPRVCRSSYASETLGAEEAFDVGQLVRGFLATARGLPMAGKAVDASINSIPLTVVVDAKDVHDKANSDTSSFGSQKSLAFTVAWLRSVLRRPNTTLRWTSTENMWVDAGTKHMDLGHLRSILREGRWSVTYCPDFVKQVAKAKKVSAAAPRKAELPLPGEPVDGHDPMLGYLSKLADQKGWHFLDGMGVNVAFQARSFRTPEPRFSSKEYPLRTTFGRMEYPIGRHVWRRLGTDESYTGHANQHALFSERFDVLITFFKKAHEASRMGRRLSFTSDSGSKSSPKLPLARSFTEAEGCPFEGLKDTHRKVSVGRFLPPVKPQDIICIGLNYRAHADELKLPYPKNPVVFMKPTTCAAGHGDAIVKPRLTEKMDYENTDAVVVDAVLLAGHQQAAALIFIDQGRPLLPIAVFWQDTSTTLSDPAFHDSPFRFDGAGGEPIGLHDLALNVVDHFMWLAIQSVCWMVKNAEEEVGLDVVLQERFIRYEDPLLVLLQNVLLKSRGRFFRTTVDGRFWVAGRFWVVWSAGFLRETRRRI
ncbi:unnamed protein product [Symbiodinium microadriaticum]|nr:unnamed protein product [Symbiodinium microadriaticum]